MKLKDATKKVLGPELEPKGFTFSMGSGGFPCYTRIVYRGPENQPVPQVVQIQQSDHQSIYGKTVVFMNLNIEERHMDRPTFSFTKGDDEDMLAAFRKMVVYLQKKGYQILDDNSEPRFLLSKLPTERHETMLYEHHEEFVTAFMDRYGITENIDDEHALSILMNHIREFKDKRFADCEEELLQGASLLGFLLARASKLEWELISYSRGKCCRIGKYKISPLASMTCCWNAKTEDELQHELHVMRVRLAAERTERGD